jgi:hypothetical protein
MIDLNELMQKCLIDANDEFAELNFEDTVYEAFRSYVIITGEPLDIEDEEEGIELLEKARRFLLDCVLLNMVRDGLVEVDSLDEDGDFVYKLVEGIVIK